MRPGRYRQQVDMSGYASGVYFYQIRVTDAQRLLFRDVGKFVLIK